MPVFFKVCYCSSQAMPVFFNPNHDLEPYISGRYWCIGTLTANSDGRRKKVDGNCPNFRVDYEVDQEERVHSLKLDMYGQGRVGSWVDLGCF